MCGLALQEALANENALKIGSAGKTVLEEKSWLLTEAFAGRTTLMSEITSNPKGKRRLYLFIMRY